MLERIQQYQIYDALIDGIPLTKEFLSKIEIDAERINTLIDKNILIQKEKDVYGISPLAIKQLYNYHGLLQKRGLTEREIKCIELCHTLEPNNREISFGLIRMYLRIKKYNKIFDVFEYLDNTQDIELQKDNNLYLYLLSIVCSYPPKYRQRILNLKYADIAVSINSSKYQDIDAQNKMRMHLIQGRHSLVIKQYNEKITRIFPCVEERAFLQEILKQVKETEELKYFSIMNLIEAKKYSEIIGYVKNKQTVKKISLFDAFLYAISKKIISITTTKKIPLVKVTNTNNLKEALQGDNYKLFAILIRKSELFNNKEKTILYKLTSEIIKLSNDIQQETIPLEQSITEETKTNITQFQNKQHTYTRKKVKEYK